MEENKSMQNVLRRLCRLVFFIMQKIAIVLKKFLANSHKVVYSGIKSGGKWRKVSRSGKMKFLF